MGRSRRTIRFQFRLMESEEAIQWDDNGNWSTIRGATIFIHCDQKIATFGAKYLIRKCSVPLCCLELGNVIYIMRIKMIIESVGCALRMTARYAGDSELIIRWCVEVKWCTNCWLLFSMTKCGKNCVWTIDFLCLFWHSGRNIYKTMAS